MDSSFVWMDFNNTTWCLRCLHKMFIIGFIFEILGTEIGTCIQSTLIEFIFVSIFWDGKKTRGKIFVLIWEVEAFLRKWISTRDCEISTICICTYFLSWLRKCILISYVHILWLFPSQNYNQNQNWFISSQMENWDCWDCEWINKNPLEHNSRVKNPSGHVLRR